MPHLKLDDALIAMIRENQVILIDVWGMDNLWLADIDWEHPMCMEEVVGGDNAFVMTKRYAEASHAIGFIAGCAAAMDVTPLELIDVVNGLPATLESWQAADRSFSLAKMSQPERERALLANRLERQSITVKKGPARKRRTRK